MLWDMIFVWGGALLVVIGVVYTASQAIRRGRLSDATPIRPGVGIDTLEPRNRTYGFSLRDNWPGLALIGLGCLLLLVGAAL
jgi:hypothetical protein